MTTATKPKAQPSVIATFATTAAKPPAVEKEKLPVVQSAVKPAAKKAKSARSVSAKPVANAATRAATRAAAKAPRKAAGQSKAVSGAKPAKPAKPAKAKKPKLVRDSFTIPKAEYAVLDDLKQRSVRLASPAKKSELLRAGIKALAAMADPALIAALAAVPAIKTGRPTNG